MDVFRPARRAAIGLGDYPLLTPISDTLMNPRRALLAVLIAGGQSLPASAGCFDWLFCKKPVQPAPFAVGAVPPTTITPLGPPVPIGPPVQVSGVQPMVAQPYAAAFSGNFPTVVNNPSVITGLPVNPTAPQVSAFRGTAQPIPTTIPATPQSWWGSSAPQTSFNAAAAYQAPAASQVAPGSWTHPMQTNPAVPPETSSGWHGMKFGNSYQTTYNNVPTTVFRPVQQIDPATGQVVIVQQPCTTTTQQVQRTPTSTVQHVPATPPPAPYGSEVGCGTETLGYPGGVPYPSQAAPQASYPSSGGSYGSYGDAGAVGSGVSQATSIQPPPSVYGYGNSQIPSTSPQPLTGSSLSNGYSATPYPSNGSNNGYTGQSPAGQGYQAAPSYPAAPSQPTAPSYPAAPSYPSSPNGTSAPNGNGTSDSSAVEQPRLEAPPLSSARPPVTGGSDFGSSTTPSTSVSTKYSDLPPIPATDDYQPPAWNGVRPNGARPNGTTPAPTTQPGQSDSMKPKISPPSWADRTAMRTNEPTREPVREPGYQASHAATPSGWQRPVTSAPAPPTIAPPKRDDGGWVAAGPTGR